MKKNKLIKWAAILGVSALIIGGGTAFYMFNMPHRDVQAIEPDYEMSAADLVNEYLADASMANEKYLEEEGESKIMAISGTVSSIDEDMNKQQVVLLKGNDSKAGVSCTFTAATNENAMSITVGNQVSIKGVIRSGAGYDEDLGLYEDVIMEKCDIYKK